MAQLRYRVTTMPFSFPLVTQSAITSSASQSVPTNLLSRGLGLFHHFMTSYPTHAAWLALMSLAIVGVTLDANGTPIASVVVPATSAKGCIQWIFLEIKVCRLVGLDEPSHCRCYLRREWNANSFYHCDYYLC